VQRDVHDRRSGSHRDDAHFRTGRLFTVVEDDALVQPFDVLAVETAADRRTVDFLDAVTRMEQAIREFAVVRHK
jgi:hypothetical protein